MHQYIYIKYIEQDIKYVSKEQLISRGTSKFLVSGQEQWLTSVILAIKEDDHHLRPAWEKC
jgi:hypothetical protein